jgi:hypothetical protein
MVESSLALMPSSDSVKLELARGQSYIVRVRGIGLPISIFPFFSFFFCSPPRLDDTCTKYRTYPKTPCLLQE